MIRKLFENIWMRNIIFFMFILFLARLTADRGSFSAFTFERFKIYFSFAVDYVWIFVHNKILIERFLLKKKLKTYALLLLISYLCYLPFYFYFNSPYDPAVGAIATAIMSLTAVKLLGLGLYFLVRYIIDKERFYKASVNAKELELEILKGQLNPHFLFNALNNIYSHLLTESKNGQELILKLSELMRYVLDSNKRKNVSIAEEIKFIENYIAFEKERLGGRCEIDYVKDIENYEVKLAPLILFTFIENAFKHGTMAIQKSEIKIKILSRLGVLELNTFNPVCHVEKDSTRVGLKNTLRRLELVYPENHSLDIHTNEREFRVNLKIMNL